MSDQRPCVDVVPATRVRANRRGRRSADRRAVAPAARSGVQASFVTSPAQTSSQRPGRASSASSPVGREQVGPELGRPAERERAAPRRLALGRRRARGRAEQRGVLAEVERDAVEPGADPDDLAGRAELVEPRRAGSRARGGGSTSPPRARPAAGAPGAGRAPPAGSPAGRSRARRAGTARRPPARPAPPPCAAPRATRGAGVAARRDRTTRARLRRGGARRERACRPARAPRAAPRRAPARGRSGPPPPRS